MVLLVARKTMKTIFILSCFLSFSLHWLRVALLSNTTIRDIQSNKSSVCMCTQKATHELLCVRKTVEIGWKWNDERENSNEFQTNAPWERESEKERDRLIQNKKLTTHRQTHRHTSGHTSAYIRTHTHTRATKWLVRYMLLLLPFVWFFC